MNFNHLAKKGITLMMIGTIIMGSSSYANEGMNHYFVRPGDTLFKIAKTRHLSLDQLLLLNPQIGNPDKIYAGQKIIIAPNNTSTPVDKTEKVIVTETLMVHTSLNAVYRGSYYDGNEQQVGIEFTLKENLIEKAQFRSLIYKGINYLQSTDSKILALKAQYETLLKQVLGKSVPEAITILQKPSTLVQDVQNGTDTLTGATLRSQKVASAFKDGLNRSPYALDANSVIYDDGVYRGVFIDGNVQQVGVEFTLENNQVKSIKYDTLNYKDINYYSETASEKTIALRKQYEALTQYLIGKNINTHLESLRFSDLIAGNTESGSDVISGATLRSGKVISAVKDALNRGVYKPAMPTAIKNTLYNQNFSDGIYRGQFMNKGEHQVSVEFTLKGNTIDSIKYKILAYKGVNYLSVQDNGKITALKSQYDALINYLKGKSINDVKGLYSPEKIASNVTVELDTLTSATLRSGKVVSAINDALVRGVYKLD